MTRHHHARSFRYPLLAQRPPEDGRLCATLLAFAFALLGSLAAALPAAAQDQPAWRAGGSIEVQSFDTADPAWEPWLRLAAGAQRKLEWGAVSIEGFRSRRFGLFDSGAAAAAYVDTWSGAYVFLGGQIVPDARVLPSSDLRLELFQGLAGGWEASAGARRLVAAEEDIDVFTVSLAKYIPAWYLRGRIDVNPSFDRTAVFYSGAARYFIPGADGIAELTLGRGEEIVEVGAGPVVDLRPAAAASLRVELFPHRSFGFGLAGTWASLEELPRRRGLAVELIARW